MNCVTVRRILSRIYAALAFVLLLALLPGTAVAQKKKKNAPPSVDNNSANPAVPLTDEQQIDYLISEVLGAWQIGDSDRMHKDYSDDVSVVNGGWAPPVLGWTAYQALYKEQRSKMQQVRMDRANTYIKVHGDTAWASFQWEFSGVIGGTPSAARGQTTYILIKKDNHWLIAHDHTSVVQTSQQQQPQTPAGATPTAPAEPQKPSN